METLEEKIARVVKEDVAVVPYDPRWPEMFEQERLHLLSCLPKDLIKRIEHFGSTAVPGLSAKPIVDILVEVVSLDETKQRIVPILEAQGYDYFWRPSWGNDTPPFYAWFIKRNSDGNRTHHIHMVEAHFVHWNRLLFRDYLIEHPDIAYEYGNLKMSLSGIHQNDRVAYTQAKGVFVRQVTEKAILWKGQPGH
ncbi:MAG: GrpB family protein [Desulfobacterales bacterium]|nr:GrpB family protein [Desulfobacterales bacterium]